MTATALPLEADLRNALSQGHLFLEYQAIVAVRTKKVVGAEALIRWDHHLHGRREPDEFIPAVEQHDIILDVGEWVVREACLQGRKWHAAGHRVRLSVNVAARQLVDRGFASRIAGIIELTRFNPKFLELEITERMRLTDIASANRTLLQLRALGVRVALDDFGTGQNNVEILRHLDVDTLKIDRSFIAPMTTNPRDHKIVGALIAAAKTLDVKIIAEGVESDEHMNLLQQLRCDEAQGYAIGMPRRASDFLLAHFGVAA